MAAKKKAKKSAKIDSEASLASESSRQTSAASEQSTPALPVADDIPSMESDSGRPGPPVVGIGASAGGLDAFKKFFSTMPAGSGIAFVLIPHLDPKHESMMVELLARCTKMQVVEAVDGLAVEANRVYVLPPNKYMTISDGVLHLTGPVERAGPQTSIDLFLRSLAEDKLEKAICIILSGTGSHGSLGLKAVKAAGGMAMVQDPSTAEYPRMPQSAIATGLADYVLPAEKMPQSLIQFVRHSLVNRPIPGAEAVETPDHLNQVLAILRARTKLDFRSYRKRMLARRLERRMGLIQIGQIGAYLSFLREHPDEVQQLARDLLISVTNFFRDPEAFQNLETEVIAPLVHSKEPDAPLRVWSAGCATGEEPYSLGILFLEQLAAAQKSCPVQIFATDVDENALDVARQGVYPESISTDISAERLARFFTRTDDAYQVGKQLRATVIFARQNLITDPPFSKLDLIVCRNVLIYLEPEIQKKVIALLHFSLKEGGFLFLGPSETIGRHVDLFEPVSKKSRIFRRIGPVRLDRVEVPVTTMVAPLVPEGRSTPTSPNRPISLADITQRLLLDQFAPAAVLINRKYEILYLFGPTDRYLAVPAGEPTQDLILMARDGLRTKLRSAVHKAVRENGPVTLADVQVKRNGDSYTAVVTIRPVQGPQNADGLLLVTFQESDRELPPPRLPESVAEDSLVRQLEYELKATKEDLQSAIEELESSNEQLKISNEEGVSMNEELQSANEELETSKEELQSLNEELTTVNNQLQDKVVDLETVNNDMANLLTCSEVAIVFLDNQFRIKRFTPPAMRVFNLIETDCNRVIWDITPKFVDDTLRHDIESVRRNLTPQEKQVHTPDGRWWNRRITPYQTLKDRIDGVVLTLADVTRVRQSDEEARRLAAVLRDSNDAVIIHDFEGKISAWNRGAVEIIGYSEAEALAMCCQQMIPDLERDKELPYWQKLFRGERVASWESQRRTKDGRILDVYVTATTLKDDMDRPVAIVKTERDVTVRKARESKLREQAERLSLAMSAGEMGTWEWDFTTNAILWDTRQFELFGIPPSQFRRLAAQVIAVIQPEDRPRVEAAIARSRTDGIPFREEFRVVHPDGSVHWLVGLGQPQRDEDGVVTRMIGVNFDTTDRKRTEHELQQLNATLERQVAERTQSLNNREQCLQAILNSAADAIITIDSRGIIQSANLAAERMFGFTGAEMLERNIKMIMPPPYRDEHDGYLEQYQKTGARKIIGIGRELEGQRKDGVRFPVELTVSEVDHLGLFTGILRDITQRKQTEAALRESERFARSTLDGLAAHIAIVGEDGRIVAVNKAWRDFAASNGADIERLAEGADYLATCDRSAGMYSTEGPLVAKGIREVLAGQAATFSAEYPCHGPGEERWFVVRVTPFPGDGPNRVVVAHENVTQRKQLEREVVEIASLEQHRIGQDLHDSVGQELTALNLLAGDLAESLRTSPKNGSKLIEQIVQGLKRSQRELRAVMRGLLPVAVDSEGLMAALSDLAERTRQEGKAMCTFECSKPVSVADNLTSTHLYLIAQEAVHNAIKHGQPKHVSITLKSDDHLLLSVRDDGTGVTALPTEHRGGLGLRIMRNRAAIIGATLTIQPAQPTGAVVTCVLAGRNP